jgi:hypothetical protein
MAPISPKSRIILEINSLTFVPISATIFIAGGAMKRRKGRKSAVVEKGPKPRGKRKPSGGARPGAGRPRTYPEGTIKAWVKARPEAARALGVTTPRELRDKLTAMIEAAPPSPPPSAGA